MFLRHTTTNENNVDTWAPEHLDTDFIFRGDARGREKGLTRPI